MESEMPVFAPGVTHVGLLGAGIMGTPMALNLIKAGYTVTVWSRTISKAESLVAAGAKMAASPKELAEVVDVVLAMLADPAAALAVSLGPTGAVAGLSKGKAYIDASTVCSATSVEIGEAVRLAGALFLEAPVSGSKGPAEQGQLIFLAAGSKELFQQSKPLFDIMGKASFFLGEVGAGANSKLVVNMIMGMMMASFAEGLALAEHAEVDLSALLEIISLSAIAAPMFALKGPSMIAGSYSPAFPLKHQAKDMRLALELAGTGALSKMPLAALTGQIYQQGVEEWGDKDFSAVREVKFERSA